jgi:subfamily B ATP-binding cassette protein MsbA
LGFILPIVELVQLDDPASQADGLLGLFVVAYQAVGVPFTLGYVVLGVSLVMIARYTTSFAVAWLREVVRTYYIRDLQDQAFRNALNAKVSYFDEEGSDDILNAIITETRFSGQVIEKGVMTMERLFLVGMYLAIMLYITPLMTGLAVGILGTITVILRVGIEPAVTVGTRVAEANERVQTAVQAGTQGSRDVKLFRMSEELFGNFRSAIDQYADAEVAISRNEAAITNFYQLAAAVTIFVLIYVGFVFSGLELGELGIFLIAMFQLAPRVSTLNSQLYSLEGALSHLVRTHEFLDRLDKRQENSGDRSVSSVEEITFDDVAFSYTDDERVLDGISFDVARGEFVEASVLDDGQIVEAGTHDELLAEAGAYAELHEMQSSA